MPHNWLENAGHVHAHVYPAHHNRIHVLYSVGQTLHSPTTQCGTHKEDPGLFLHRPQQFSRSTPLQVAVSRYNKQTQHNMYNSLSRCQKDTMAVLCSSNTHCQELLYTSSYVHKVGTE